MEHYKFKTTDIKGKKYVEVNQRVIALRNLSEYKGFSIETELLHLEADSCVVRATIRNANGVIAAQGIAQEDRSSSNINKTSYVENCETSAVGRALGFLGIGIETSIATADEVSMAIGKQESMSVKADAPLIGVDAYNKCFEYIKSAKDKQQAYDMVAFKYGGQFTDKQKADLVKLVG